MKTICALAICLLVIIASSGGCRQVDGHRDPGAVSEDNNQMPDKDQLPANVSVRLRKSGGLFAIQREWLFYSDGKIRHPNGEITKLEEKTARRILSQKRIDSLSDLAPEYHPPLGSADFQTIELTVRGSKGIFKISAADSNELVPEKLWSYCDVLEEAAKKSSGPAQKE